MKVIVNQVRPFKVTVPGIDSRTAIVNPQGPQGPEGPPGPPGAAGPAGQDGANGIASLSQATDVDLTNLADGAVLIYNTDTSKWEAGTTFESQYIEGGHF